MLNDLLELKKIKEGDIKAFENLFKSYYSPLYTYAVNITKRSDVAEEIIQDLFYKMWRDRECIQIVTSLSGYLYGAVRNKSFHYLEHRNVQTRHSEKVLLSNTEQSSITPQDQLEYMEFEGLINQALLKMPERRSKIFRMHKFQNIKYSEIATMFSLSVKTIEAEMSKAYKTLRKVIESYK